MLSRMKKWLPLVWGTGIGLGAGSYLWGSSRAAALIIGDKIIFTLVIPLATLFICLIISLAALDAEGGSPPSS